MSRADPGNSARPGELLMAPTIPSGWRLAYTDILAEHLYAQFIALLQGGSTRPIPPLALSVQIVGECLDTARVMVEAYHNPVKLEKFDAERYDQHQPKRETVNHVMKTIERLSERFPPGPVALIARPAIILDMYDRIIGWYLPGTISRHRQSQIDRSAPHIYPSLRGTVSRPGVGGWRGAPNYFTENVQFNYPPGTINLSPGWFQQGHDSPAHALEVSATLKHTNPNQGCREWLAETWNYEAIMSGILRVAHPSVYYGGRDAILAMDTVGHLKVAAASWTSVFSAISIISNRESPLHRDSGSCSRSYDLLTTIGGDDNLRMSWPSCGLEFEYRSGTTMLFSGNLLAHGVTGSERERVCYAHYMKDGVHERLGIKSPNWATKGLYNTFCNINQ